MNDTKEVFFDYWCERCEHNDKEEYEDPCDICLDQGWNIDSHKPIMFSENKYFKEGAANGERRRIYRKNKQNQHKDSNK